ncbi:MAG: hypothetical protein AAGC46_19515, partial [Solirubrobacteraceae bacterium]|nr:hypothetical protein [Patulibacter sp.]
IQRVDVYTARLTMQVETKASSVERDWSTVTTSTAITGTIRARVDGLVFVDGIPQEANHPFTATSATDIALTQTAHYTSPLGQDSGSCHQTSTDATPVGTGLVSTSLGANAEDGSRQISIAVTSPDALWVEKTCEGYLKYERADPLMQKGSFHQAYMPLEVVGQPLFGLVMGGSLDCPKFIHIDDCKTVYSGRLDFERTASYDRGEPDPPAPGDPGPAVPPAGAPPAAIEAFLLKVMVRAAREDRYAQAVVRCGKPCEGHVSAYAIALSKQGRAKGPATKLGSTSFTSTADGTATPRVPLSRADRALARRRGALELRTDATPTGGGTPQRVSSTVRFR